MVGDTFLACMGGFRIAATAKMLSNFFVTAPTHSHATWVAVYPALFITASVQPYTTRAAVYEASV